MTNEEFNKKTLFTSKLHSNLRKKLVNCYIWSRNLQVPEMDTSESRSGIPGKF